MIWLILAVLLWEILHSILASLKAKELVRGRIGTRLMRFYRLLYNFLAVLTFIPILALAAVTPDRKLYLVAFPWSGLMIIGEILAVAILLIGVLQTGAMDFIGLRQLGENKQPARLTTSGLYHYVRHPLYSAGLAFIWLLPYMTANVLVINIGLTVYVVLGTFFEERKLKLEFGQQYADYAMVTPMFVPFLKGNKKPR
jgi:protein-S-isoprenylcysteine O-methyltransferase Ste14